MYRPIMCAAWAAFLSISMLSCGGDEPLPYSPGGDVSGQNAPLGGGEQPGVPPSSPFTCTTDLLCAQDFNVLVFTDYSGGVDIGGHVAVGGSLTMQSFSVGHQRGGGDAIIAGGDVTLTNGSVHGSIVHGGDAFVNVSVGIEKDGEIVNAATVDFGQCATSICGKSQAMFELAPNATTSVEYVGDQAILHLSGINHLVNVFHVNADDLSAARAVSINIPADSTAIVNVSGEFLSLTNFAFNFLNDSDFQRLLINGPQLTRVDIHGFALDGSMLVCNADVWFDNGQMKGTLISKALSGPGEFHSRPFQGCLP